MVYKCSSYDVPTGHQLNYGLVKHLYFYVGIPIIYYTYYIM